MSRARDVEDWPYSVSLSVIAAVLLMAYLLWGRA